MKKTIGAAFMLFGALVAAVTVAQVSPQTLPASTVWGRLGISAGPGQAIPFNVLIANLNLATALTGDCTSTVALVTTCLKTNGAAFATSATTDTTNATNIASGTLAVARGGTGIGSGTSGGIPYYSGSTTIASSGALTANRPIIGGGAGVAPSVGTVTGNTTTFATSTGSLTSGNCIKSDASGNLIDAGAACGGAASRVLLNTLTASASASLTDTTSITGTYKNYELAFDNITPDTNGVTCRLRVTIASVVQTSGYAGVSFIALSNSSTSFGTNSTEIRCSTVTALQTTAPGVNGTITAFNPSANQITAWNSMFSFELPTSVHAVMMSSANYNTVGVINGFELSMSSGNIASGTVKVYGLN